MVLLQAPVFQLLDHLAIFAGFHEIGARSFDRGTPLKDDPVLHRHTAIEILQMRVMPPKLFAGKAGVILTQHDRIAFEFAVEPREFVFGRFKLARSLGEHLLLLVFDALAMIEHRFESEFEFGHYATLMSCAMVSSNIAFS